MRRGDKDYDDRVSVGLAYVYLVEADVETSVERVREALFRFLDHHGVDWAKDHEAMTRAWIMAVRHFMERSPVPVSTAKPC